MANIRLLKGTSSVTRETADGGFIEARGTRDGALFTASVIDGWALEGRIFAANSGSLTTPDTYATAAAANEASMLVDIPDGIIGIPISIEFTISTGTTNLFEILAVASSTLAVGTAGTGPVTIHSTRMDKPHSSRATVWTALNSGGNTTPYTGNYYEFFRDGYPTDATVTGGPATTYRWSAKSSGTYPIIVDGGSITIFSGGAAHTGFCTITWAELPESYIK